MKYFLKNDQLFMNKKQLIILGIYNYHRFFLLIAISIYKNNNNLFCYDFTYS